MTSDRTNIAIVCKFAPERAGQSVNFASSIPGQTYVPRLQEADI